VSVCAVSVGDALVERSCCSDETSGDGGSIKTPRHTNFVPIHRSRPHALTPRAHSTPSALAISFAGTRRTFSQTPSVRSKSTRVALNHVNSARPAPDTVAIRLSNITVWHRMNAGGLISSSPTV